MAKNNNLAIPGGGGSGPPVPPLDPPLLELLLLNNTDDPSHQKISYAVTARLIGAFVFRYRESAENSSA